MHPDAVSSNLPFNKPRLNSLSNTERGTNAAWNRSVPLIFVASKGASSDTSRPYVLNRFTAFPPFPFISIYYYVNMAGFRLRFRGATGIFGVCISFLGQFRNFDNFFYFGKGDREYRGQTCDLDLWCRLHVPLSDDDGGETCRMPHENLHLLDT